MSRKRRGRERGRTIISGAMEFLVVVRLRLSRWLAAAQPSPTRPDFLSPAAAQPVGLASPIIFYSSEFSSGSRAPINFRRNLLGEQWSSPRH